MLAAGVFLLSPESDLSGCDISGLSAVAEAERLGPDSVVHSLWFEVCFALSETWVVLMFTQHTHSTAQGLKRHPVSLLISSSLT